MRVNTKQLAGAKSDKYNKNRINTKLITVKQIFTCNCMDKFKTDGNQIH